MSIQHWEEVLMDFIAGLPMSKGNNVIIVVVDLMTKYVHFYFLYHPFKSSAVGATFMEIV